MTVAELYEELIEVQPSAEIFVQVERGDETLTTAVADVLHVTNVDGSAVVLRLAQS
jgi:hypothetical protein